MEDAESVVFREGIARVSLRTQLKWAKESALKALIKARKSAGHSQLEAGRIVGISTLEYRKVERGEQSLNELQLKKLAERFQRDFKHFEALCRTEE